jgi:tetratricopeptide (TPR) repeat protein
VNSPEFSTNQPTQRYPDGKRDEVADGSFTARWREWLEGRDHLRLLAAPPFLAAVGALLGYVIFVAGWNPAHAVAKVRGPVNAAYQARDYATATVGYRGLLQLQGAGEPEYRFRLALSQLNLGRQEEAFALMLRLAPLAKPGYAPAHLQVALSLLSDTNLTAWSIPLAEQHLKHVVALDPASAQAHELLGNLNLRQGNYAEAKKHLLEAVQTRNEAILPLARALQALGEDAGVRQWADRALRHYRSELERPVPNEVELRLRMVETLLLLQDPASAQSVLEVAWKLNPNPAYETALGDVAAIWATTLAEQKPPPLALRLNVVQRGLEHAPQNLRLLEQLVALSMATGPEAAAAREALDPILKEGGRAAWVHFFLGLLARQQGDDALARKHYELAYEMAPDLAYLANNLAVLLVADKNPDLPRAFSLIDPLVAKYPDNPHSRETRGQVLAKMGRYQEAVKDLEMALPGIQGAARLNTYAALSAAYRGLGMADVAETYQRLASGKPAAPAAAPKLLK